jgi:hypothetical protein
MNEFGYVKICLCASFGKNTYLLELLFDFTKRTTLPVSFCICEILIKFALHGLSAYISVS